MSSPYVSLLESLRAYCKLPEFPNPLPSNKLLLQLNNGLSITINFEDETSMVVLFSELGTYKAENELSVLSKIAQANFLWAATGGSTLSAQPEMQTVHLAYQTPITSLEANLFIECIQEFTRVGEQWQRILKKIDEDHDLENTITNETQKNEVTFIPDHLS